MPSRNTSRNTTSAQLIETIKRASSKEYSITVEETRFLITATISLFRVHLIGGGKYSEDGIRPLITKFRDAGRRSAPWRPASSKVPGRPQDGADGNRISRWLLPTDHKFYADEITATLVEVKYFFQTLSMENCPPLPPNTLQDSFMWLLKDRVEPGIYQDPIQLIPINFNEFVQYPRLVQSGHLIPLDRGGKHKPDNAFLMLDRSNQIQGNQTLDELIALMERIVVKHRSGNTPPELNVDPSGND